MCIQVTECYAHCRCIYYKHSIDPCPGHAITGHKVTFKEVSVGYSCSRHSSSSVDRHGQLQPRRGHTAQRPELGTVPEQAPHAPTSEKHPKSRSGSISLDKPEHRKSTLLAPVLGRTQSPTLKQTDLLNGSEARVAEAGECRCPCHPHPSLASRPSHCRWCCNSAVEQGFSHDRRELPELGDAEKAVAESIGDHEIYVPGNDRPRLIILYRAHLLELSKNLSNDLTALEVGSLKMLFWNLLSDVTQPTTEMDTADTVDLPNEPGSDSGIERTIGVHTHLPRFRLCYLLIVFGALTVAGSLAPAIWRSQADHDLSGGFALAQYILGVGVFAVGSVAAIHSRSCTCWQR